MAEAVKRAKIQLWLEWFEKNPRIMAKVEDKLRSLIGTYGAANKGIRKLIPAGDRLNRAMEISRDLYKENKVKAADLSSSQAWMKEVLGRLAAEEAEAGLQAKSTKEKLGAMGQKINRVGYRLGWFAFRTMVVGKMLMRWMLTPVKKGMKALMDWEKTLESTVTTLGLLSATGMLTGEREQTLLDLTEKLVTVGPKFQAAWGYLQAVLTAIAVDIGEPLIDVFLSLGDAILEVWQQVKPKLLPAIQDLISTALPQLLDIIKEVGPAFIMGFMEGLKYAVPALLSLFNTIKPLIPTIGTLIGFILPFAPLLLAIGTAAYLLSPILVALGVALQIIAFLLPATAGGAMALAPAIVAVGTAAVSASAGLLIIAGVALAIGAAFLMAGAGVALASNGIAMLADRVEKIIPLVSALLGVAAGMIAISAAGIAMIPAAAGVFMMAGATVALGAGLFALTASLWALIPALKAFESVSGTVLNIVGGLGGAIGNLTNSLLNLCFKHATPDVESFAENIKEADKGVNRISRDVSGLGRDLRGAELGGGLGGASGEVAAGSTTQHITIYPEINIESISGEVDLDRVQNAVNRGISEALRRRS